MICVAKGTCKKDHSHKDHCPPPPLGLHISHYRYTLQNNLGNIIYHVRSLNFDFSTLLGIRNSGPTSFGLKIDFRQLLRILGVVRGQPWWRYYVSYYTLLCIHDTSLGVTTTVTSRVRLSLRRLTDDTTRWRCETFRLVEFIAATWCSDTDVRLLKPMPRC